MTTFSTPGPDFPQNPKADAGDLPPVDTAGGIAIDLRCTRCQYNLRSQPLNAFCPECGTPVVQSAAGYRRDQLIYADPRWVRTVARGGKFLIAMYATIVLAWFASAVLSFISSGLGPPQAGTYAFACGQWLLMLLTCGFAIAGLVMISSPCPDMPVEQKSCARRWVRWLLVVNIVLPFVALFFGILASITWVQRPSLPPTYIFVLMACAWALCGISSLALAFAVCRHLRNLMKAAQAGGIAAFAAVLSWFTIPVGLMLPIGALALWGIAFTVAPAFTSAAAPTKTAPAGVTLPAGVPTGGEFTTIDIGGAETVFYSYVPSAGAGGTTGGADDDADDETSEQDAAPSSAASPNKAVNANASPPTGFTIKTTGPGVNSVISGGMGSVAAQPGAVTIVVTSGASGTATAPAVPAASAMSGFVLGAVLLGFAVLAAMLLGICGAILVILATVKLSAVAREAARFQAESVTPPPRFV